MVSGLQYAEDSVNAVLEREVGQAADAHSDQ